MDIYSYLIKDHKKIKNLLEQTLSANGMRRKELFEKIKSEVILHSIAEQATFYQLLTKYNESREKPIQGHTEHQNITRLLEKLDNLADNNPKWQIIFDELKTQIEHHVRVEETEVFAIARKVLTKNQAMQMATAMEEKKQELLEVV